MMVNPTLAYMLYRHVVEFNAEQAQDHACSHLFLLRESTFNVRIETSYISAEVLT